VHQELHGGQFFFALVLLEHVLSHLQNMVAVVCMSSATVSMTSACMDDGNQWRKPVTMLLCLLRIRRVCGWDAIEEAT
jgi:hypothetical protein